MSKWKINTSNKGKLEEFRKYLSGTITSMLEDIAEPDSDPLTVIQYKASQFENVIVDDTSLEIEGEDIGVNIKWLMDSLPNFLGKKAVFTCLLGINCGDEVKIYKGLCNGVIVSPKGESFGFNKYFRPDSQNKTFGEFIPDDINPRKIAVDNLLKDYTWVKLPLMKTWKGKFQ